VQLDLAGAGHRDRKVNVSGVALAGAERHHPGVVAEAGGQIVLVPIRTVGGRAHHRVEAAIARQGQQDRPALGVLDRYHVGAAAALEDAAGGDVLHQERGSHQTTARRPSGQQAIRRRFEDVISERVGSELGHEYLYRHASDRDLRPHRPIGVAAYADAPHEVSIAVVPRPA